MIAEESRLPDCQSRVNDRAKAALLWGVLVFLAVQGVLAYIASRAHPEIRDPEYGYRLVRLRAQAKAAPDHPLLLILGSSRTLSGICPPSLPAWPSDSGAEPRVFNFSLFGAGPVRELMVLRRLLAAGHRPEWLLVEVWPPYWPQQGYWLDELHIMQHDLRPEDLSVVARYFIDRSKAVGKLAAETLTPIVSLRSNFLARWTACLLSPDQRWRVDRFAYWQDGESTGWHPWLQRGSDEDFRLRATKTKLETKPCLDHFSISETADQAMRELLDECRRQKIKAALILMPEHSELRSWYTPAVQEKVDGYLTRLKNEYQIPVFDTREWVADEEFHDLTHMAPPAAPPFTQRLGREALWPWLAGKIATDEHR
ncbi:MAG TPA: hypothetical protein VH575_26670 [Gemmataceae bacterium]